MCSFCSLLPEFDVFLEAMAGTCDFMYVYIYIYIYIYIYVHKICVHVGWAALDCVWFELLTKQDWLLCACR